MKSKLAVLVDTDVQYVFFNGILQKKYLEYAKPHLPSLPSCLLQKSNICFYKNWQKKCFAMSHFISGHIRISLS